MLLQPTGIKGTVIKIIHVGYVRICDHRVGKRLHVSKPVCKSDGDLYPKKVRRLKEPAFRYGPTKECQSDEFSESVKSSD